MTRKNLWTVRESANYEADQNARVAIFDKIRPATHWKDPIDAVIRESEFADCNEAAIFFTGSALTIVERLDEGIEWLESLDVPVVARETGNPRTVGMRFDPRGLTEALVRAAGDVTLEHRLPADVDGDLVLATGGFGVRLAREAFHDTNFFLRTKHLEQLAAILQDPEASANDRYVALTLLKNAEIAARSILPMCQDTGTASIFAKKGQQVWTGANDAEWLSGKPYSPKPNICA